MITFQGKNECFYVSICVANLRRINLTAPRTPYRANNVLENNISDFCLDLPMMPFMRITSVKLTNLKT